jgi:hypothetical protein
MDMRDGILVGLDERKMMFTPNRGAIDRAIEMPGYI